MGSMCGVPVEDEPNQIQRPRQRNPNHNNQVIEKLPQQYNQPKEAIDIKFHDFEEFDSII
jgi:hypothetical protein